MIMKRYILSLYVVKYFIVLAWRRLPTPRPFVNIRCRMSATWKKYRLVDVFFKTFLKRETVVWFATFFPYTTEKGSDSHRPFALTMVVRTGSDTGTQHVFRENILVRYAKRITLIDLYLRSSAWGSSVYAWINCCYCTRIFCFYIDL